MKKLIIFILLVALFACNAPQKQLSFKSITISNSAELWWARVLADINQDGVTDMVLQHKNGFGGWLGWLEGTTNTTQLWKTHIISEGLEDGRLFAAGDLDLGDMDGDGDIDVIGVVHPGEWASAGAPADLFWFENPTWKRHTIGQIPNALKDINVADLDGDGKNDIVTMNFEEHYLTIFKQVNVGEFEIAFQTQITNLHEGMDIGDIDGDGFTDISANGYFIKNPGNDISQPWDVSSIDEIWHNQTGDWSRNATKTACYDIDDDGKKEVFISHSERSGYPIALYDLENGEWSKTVLLDSLAAAHNLQLFDFDLDGDVDVLTGMNKGRAWNLNYRDFPVYILLNQQTGWDTLRISSEGIYNAQVSDYDGDGDFDIFHYPSHADTTFHLLINQIR